MSLCWSSASRHNERWVVQDLWVQRLDFKTHRCDRVTQHIPDISGLAVGYLYRSQVSAVKQRVGLKISKHQYLVNFQKCNKRHR